MSVQGDERAKILRRTQAMQDRISSIMVAEFTNDDERKCDVLVGAAHAYVCALLHAIPNDKAMGFIDAICGLMKADIALKLLDDREEAAELAQARNAK